MVNFTEILNQLTKKIPTGIINLYDRMHRWELSRLLSEQTDPITAESIIEEIENKYGKIEEKGEDPGKGEFSAVSKDSGKKVYFKTQKSRDAAIQAGTHTSDASDKPSTDAAAGDTKKKEDSGGGDASSLAAQIAGGVKKDASKKEKEEKKKAKKAKVAKLPPKSKPVLVKAIPVVLREIPKKNKGLGPINYNHFKQKPLISDIEFNEKISTDKVYKKIDAKPFKLKVPDFPAKYATLVERSLMVEKYDEVKPPLSYFYAGGGAGQISSQVAEVLMMAFVKTKEKEKRAELKERILSHIETIPKGTKLIIDKTWVEAAYLQAESLHARLSYLHPKGYNVAQVAWDNKDDVEAIGMTNYKENKGFSTDVYFRIELPDGSTYLLEDSLKKDEKVFLLNTSTNEIRTFGVNKLDAKLASEYSELKFRYNYEKIRPSEKKKIYGRIKQIEDIGESKLPQEIRPSTFKEQQYSSLMELGKLFEKYVPTASGKRMPPKIDDKVLMKAFGSKQADKKFAIAAIKALSAGKIGTEEYAVALKKLAGVSDMRKQLKAVVYVGEYFAESGNGNIRKAMDDHYAIARKYQKDFLIGISTDSQLRNGLMSMIDTTFPLRALFEGDEQADIDSLPVFKESLSNMFKTDSYEDLRTHLVIRKNEYGIYELLYTTANKYEVIPIATINARQRGIGYDQNLALEMYLHPKFAQRIAKSNAELGIMTPGIQKQLDKMAGIKTTKQSIKKK